MANWTDNKKHGNLEASSFQSINYENLVQGSLYILKVKIVTISLFEGIVQKRKTQTDIGFLGWNDDMCCFSVLRKWIKNVMTMD